jgi:NTP pyrophosphatase (non-canonical NTP hydrolase)
MNLNELQSEVIAWANDKDILKRENVTKQLLKFDEESGELSGAIIKNNHDLIVDSIGDTLVTLVILAEQLGYKLSLEVLNNAVLDNVYNVDAVGMALNLIRLKGLLCQRPSSETLRWCIDTTLEISHVLNLSPAHCLETAYNVIKNRKGQTVNGTFVKEEDLV